MNRDEANWRLLQKRARERRAKVEEKRRLRKLGRELNSLFWVAHCQGAGPMRVRVSRGV